MLLRHFSDILIFWKIFKVNYALILASIQALNSHEIKSLAVKDTIAALNLVGQKVNRLEVNWIKAHVGHPGNELADKLARESLNQQENAHGIFPPYSHFKSELWTAMYKIWSTEWQSHPTCRLSKKILPHPDRNKSKQILNLSRGQMRRLLELITGQSNLNYVQSKIYPEDVSPLCRFCEEEDETFAHLLNACPCFNSYRRDMLHNRPVINLSLIHI